MTHYITIDPGLQGTGFAIWSSSKHKLALHGSISPRNKKAPVELRALELSERLVQLSKEYDLIETVYFELPASWGGVSDKSQAVVKLTLAAGILVGTMCRVYGCGAKAVPVADWKGQLPGDICCQRVATKMGWAVSEYSDHDLDAVGIGLYIQGRF